LGPPIRQGSAAECRRLTKWLIVRALCHQQIRQQPCFHQLPTRVNRSHQRRLWHLIKYSVSVSQRSRREPSCSRCVVLSIKYKHFQSGLCTNHICRLTYDVLGGQGISVFNEKRCRALRLLARTSFTTPSGASLLIGLGFDLPKWRTCIASQRGTNLIGRPNYRAFDHLADAARCAIGFIYRQCFIYILFLKCTLITFRFHLISLSYVTLALDQCSSFTLAPLYSVKDFTALYKFILHYINLGPITQSMFHAISVSDETQQSLYCSHHSYRACKRKWEYLIRSSFHAT